MTGTDPKDKIGIKMEPWWWNVIAIVITVLIVVVYFL